MLIPSIATVAPPAVEPITLADAKRALKIEHDHEDALLARYIATARALVERFTRLRLITQRVRLTYDAFPAVIRPPIAPAQAVASIKYDDADGAERTLDAAEYAMRDGKPVLIAPGYGKTWPATRAYMGAVRVELIVGYGDDGDAAPADILGALRLALGDQERFRSNTLYAGLNELPLGVKPLLLPHVLPV